MTAAIPVEEKLLLITPLPPFQGCSFEPKDQDDLGDLAADRHRLVGTRLRRAVLFRRGDETAGVQPAVQHGLGAGGPAGRQADRHADGARRHSRHPHRRDLERPHKARLLFRRQARYPGDVRQRSAALLPGGKASRREPQGAGTARLGLLRRAVPEEDHRDAKPADLSPVHPSPDAHAQKSDHHVHRSGLRRQR